MKKEISEIITQAKAAIKASEEVIKLATGLDQDSGESDPEPIEIGYTNKVFGLELTVSADPRTGLHYDFTHEIRFKADEKVNGREKMEGTGNILCCGKRSYWNCYPKRHFLLTVYRSCSLFGLNKATKFLLIPAYADRSLMRNALAFRISQLIGLEYSYDYRYVELYINGAYWGLYLIVDYLASCESRLSPADSIFMLDVGNGGSDVDSPVWAPDGNFPAEHSLTDKDRDSLDKYRFTTVKKQFPIIVRDGDSKLAETVINNFERALYDRNDHTGKYLTFINLDSFARFYILEEITKDMEGLTEKWKYHSGYNHDFGRNGHPKYIFAYIKKGIIHMGPGFMFEYGTFAQNGSINNALYPFMNAGFWYQELFTNHGTLLNRVKEIWKAEKLADKLSPANFNQLVKDITASIKDAVNRDNVRWGITSSSDSALLLNTSNTNDDGGISWEDSISRMVKKYDYVYNCVKKLCES